MIPAHSPLFFLKPRLVAATLLTVASILPVQASPPSGTDARLFVRHPTHCSQFLGGHHSAGGDSLTSDYAEALSKALDAHPRYGLEQRLALVQQACLATHPGLAGLGQPPRPVPAGLAAANLPSNQKGLLP